MDSTLVAQLAIIVVVFVALIHAAAGMVWVERKVCAYIQQRVGAPRGGAARLRPA